ncbi:MAG TPA: UrcA family protein [Steroidobacteraceae bacterium]|nr:UrcA family protein [Steroidobacteraceae bacterium]
MNSSSWSLRILAACLLAGVLAQSSLAQAEPGAEVPTALVRFHDLNLNSASGVRTLYGRIRLAAAEVCAPLEPDGSLVHSAAWRVCMDSAIATAVRRVDSPLLTAYHERRLGRVIASVRVPVRAGE